MTSKAIAVLVLILGVARVAYGIAIIQQNMTFKSCGNKYKYLAKALSNFVLFTQGVLETSSLC